MSHETSTISRFLVTLRYEDIPDEVIEHTKRLVLNLLGAGLWGWGTAGGNQSYDVLSAMGGDPESAVFGATTRLPAPTAAAVNAALAFASKADDTHGPAFVHPGHAIIPSVLAVGEARDISGREAITAVVGAMEAGLRVARSVAPAEDLEHNSTTMGFWSEVKCAILAAMAASVASGQDQNQVAHAIGIAATSSSGLLSSAGYGPPPHRTPAGSVYAWDAGKAAMLGVLASRLAGTGMTAAPRPLEGERGWVRTYTGGHGRMESLTEGLGVEYAILDVIYKTRPMSHTIFATVDAVGAIVADQQLDIDDIAEIIVTGPAYLGENFWRTEIDTFEDAASSAPFAIALNVVSPGVMTLLDTAVAHLHDERVMSLMQRCRFDPDPLAPLHTADLPGSVTIRTADGHTHHRVEQGSGHRIGDADLAEKLIRAAAGRLPPGRAEAIGDVVVRLEHLDSVRDLTRLLQP